MHVSAGQHVLIATAEGHQTEKVTMTLALGDRREIELELRKPPGLLSRWWFWTGIGVVVAAGAATAVALNIERDPQRGTFGGGLVTGP